MSEEIVRRLREMSHRNHFSLKDSMPKDGILDEADEDDDEELDDEEGRRPSSKLDKEEDDGSAPPQGSPSPKGMIGNSADEDTGEDEEEEEPEPVRIQPPTVESPNPLDNQYAANFTIGDEVSLVSSNGKSLGLKATIEGYDKEGFYRIKLEDGTTVNGMTDLAIASLIKSTKESVCVCGSSKFLTEGNYIVCDTCGRPISEDMDQLTKLDKARPKGKRMIRSIPHDMSTAKKPNISDAVGESIRRSLDKKRSDTV